MSVHTGQLKNAVLQSRQQKHIITAPLYFRSDINLEKETKKIHFHLKSVNLLLEN